MLGITPIPIFISRSHGGPPMADIDILIVAASFFILVPLTIGIVHVSLEPDRTPHLAVWNVLFFPFWIGYGIGKILFMRLR